MERQKESTSLGELLVTTLARELEEEVGISNLVDAQPLGVVVDHSTLLSSRHVGFLYNVVQDHPLFAKATEEFSKRSRLNGQFVTNEELARFHTQFDPWSRLIFEDMIRLPGTRALPRQRAFSFDT